MTYLFVFESSDIEEKYISRELHTFDDTEQFEHARSEIITDFFDASAHCHSCSVEIYGITSFNTYIPSEKNNPKKLS